jgi:NAD+ dependent glucose-6-phosphate dehydrogenase
MAKKSILITGVYGLVGSSIYRYLMEKPEQYELFGMARRRKKSDRVADEEAIEVPQSHFFSADLSDPEVLVKAFKGMDTVVHMAADPNTEAPWDSVLKNNIQGAYHVLEAAKLAGVRRVIYASTVQVTTGYGIHREPYRSIREGRLDNVPSSYEPVKTIDRPWPVNLYAASKVFGETLARVYTETSHLSCLCLRIGAVNTMDSDRDKFTSLFCTRRDIARLTECCIEAPDTVKYDIFYGMSDNEYLWTDIQNAADVVGYVPADKFRD